MDIDEAQITTEENIASYVYELSGYKGDEEDASEAGREILQIVLKTLSAEEFAQLKEIFAS